MATGADERRWNINAEAVHNWRNRAREWAQYYGALPAAVHAAITAAHDQHHTDGISARVLAERLAAQYPCLELVSG
jgi:hypothetical protein